MSTPVEDYDLLILVDATYSMSSYLSSLQKSLPQIISISTLTGCFSRIGLLAYKDYSDRELLDWSGWLLPSHLSVDRPAVDLIAKAKSLCPMGGGDGPEACKTGMARAYELMRADATTIILLYTDAPPHTVSNGLMNDSSSNLGPEQRALGQKTSYGGYGPNFRDWVSASQLLRAGNKAAQVFCILEREMHFNYAGYYNYLSTMTGGACVYLADSKPTSISKVTVELLLSWMGAEKEGSRALSEFPAYLSRYLSIENIKTLSSESDPAARLFFYVSSQGSNGSGSANITKVQATSETLKKYLPKKSTPVSDFAKRYVVDAGYRKTAFDHMARIIGEDVSAISLNPVFGSLWRAICNDRGNEAREEIINSFGLQVDRIADTGEKSRMKLWLEESYDYTAQVMETIDSVPETQRFPCVCLDPTLVFTRETADAISLTENTPIHQFRRDELLEIGRSCDYRILRRLSHVLTRLTYIESASEMPTHLALAGDSETPKIPMALARAEHKRQFWRILLHIVVPGTMLSARPAALLAALSIHLGIAPLFDAAAQELLLWRDRWNDLTIPETWNVSCLGLLLDADEAYQSKTSTQEVYQSEASTIPDSGGLLNRVDRDLFEQLALYRMLELNMETSLQALVGWTPNKTVLRIGPTTTCQSCGFPRSVTIMGPGGKCGHCLWDDWPSPSEREACITAHVGKEDDEQTPATWVECNINSCRAQYVVYRPEKLNVKPKCHYCRNGRVAPVLECSGCLNRIIWPDEYRPSTMTGFRCYACQASKKSITPLETNAQCLAKENGIAWLLRNDGKIAEPFNGRSLFHVISTAGPENFCQRVEVLPSNATFALTLKGKVVQNTTDMLSSLRSWVQRRKAESGNCSLCFSDIRKSNLLLSCKRSGCSQRVCRDCLVAWYGLNRPGEIINTAALFCPFCRRDPSARTLAKFGMGIHAVGNLKDAVRDSGGWIFAWCLDCSHAKQYMERVCAAGAPQLLSGWSCDQCRSLGGSGKFGAKECPGCTTMTEKTDGCGHITCTVPGCETHWCYFCGDKFSPDTIYEHMSFDHGGLYGDEDDNEDWQPA